MTLDNVNKLLGSKISIGAYTVTPKYYADASQSAEITDKTEIGKFILRVDNSKLVYDTKLATVDFRAAGVSGDVGKNVVCAHKIVINVDGKATTATIEAPQTYIITNQAGATFTFKETPKPLAWSYAFVKNGIAGQTATPEISDNIFGEIALVNDIDLPKEDGQGRRQGGRQRSRHPIHRIRQPDRHGRESLRSGRCIRVGQGL